MTLETYYEKYGSRITQASERLFVEDFLYPLLGSKIEEIVPQHPFIDSTGRSRKIDFAYVGASRRLALEVNGETYHAEGIIPDNAFDDNLFRQNEILRLGYRLIRFSYSQLQSPAWRPLIQQSLRDFVGREAPELLTEYALAPTPLQSEALGALDFYRDTRGWARGVLVLPTGTGKTVLSAMDARRVGGRVLFLVHRLDILKQSIDAFRIVWPDLTAGLLTEVRENELTCDVLFASKDTLRRPEELARFERDWFDYIVVDEVHHGQSPSYREILAYFQPKFMLGMTATPDRTDRKDIFELFEYNKVFEISLAEAIEHGYLVPYTYLGLTDNVDYSRIRYENNKYRVDDLERLLIIPERNNAIVQEYLAKGHGDKAIGFCVSIQHAERMVEVFRENGISAAAIHSQSPDRDQLLADFRNDKIQVAFTVDLFNEGVDFPNVRVLLFLRPTESKTVFLQQLGRGLRLCAGKDRVTVIDFIANYKRANKIRKYLAKDSKVVTGEPDQHGRRRRKFEYLYSTGCEVLFDAEVEEILSRQDADEIGITPDDLKEAYFALAEKLGRKPAKSDLDSEGEYKSAQYIRSFGSWVAFLREVGEYTEASYHYPQGVHLGHVLSILYFFGKGDRTGTHFDDEYIRLRGGLGEGRVAAYRRQVKYKLLAAMELGILTDDRNYPGGTDYTLELTALGKQLFNVLEPTLKRFDLSFPRESDSVPSTRMRDDESSYNAALRNFITSGVPGSDLLLRILLEMPAAQQMLRFLYHVTRAKTVRRSNIYEQFFQTPFVKQFCDQEGIEEATLEASRRRCPFLLNVLDACGAISAGRDSVSVDRLIIMDSLVRPNDREEPAITKARIANLVAAWPDKANQMPDEDLSILRELFGKDFLESSYFLDQLAVVEEEDA